MSHKRIHPLDLMANKTADLCIVDVRTVAEVNALALPDCLHIPLHELTPARLRADITKSGKNGKNGKNGSSIYLLCQSGKRAEMAADQLQDQLDAELIIIEGGINALRDAQIPLQQSGKAVMSLERQVRIAAGFLVFSGVLLGSLFNPGFYWISGFVGAGLMFAGITDTCMMGMLIARMPWNR